MDIDVLKKQLGLRLKELRVAKGLRQEDLDKWDFSYRYYGKLERGLNNPTIETLVKVCEIFGVTLSDLFLFMGANKNASEERERVSIKLAKVLNDSPEGTIKKLRIFLEEII